MMLVFRLLVIAGIISNLVSVCLTSSNYENLFSVIITFFYWKKRILLAKMMTKR